MEKLNKLSNNIYSKNKLKNKLKNNTDEIKDKTTKILSLDFFLNFDINSFENFVDFQHILNEKINLYFEDKIKWKSDLFISTFLSSSIATPYKSFNNENLEEKKELLNLILEKRELYTKIFLNLLIKWKFDKIFTYEDKKTIEILIKSDFFKFIDNIYLKESYKDFGDYLKPNKQKYWIYKNWKSKSFSSWFYKDELEQIKQKIILIPNKNIKNYLLKFIELSNSWKIKYESYIELEKYALKTWDNESKLWLMWPLESYENPWFTDLEFSLVLKNKSNPDINKTYENLFEKNYKNSYNVNKIWIFEVEKILSSWCSSYMSVLWQAFPNDNESKENFWNKITIYSSHLNQIFKEKYDLLKKIVTNLDDLDEEKLFLYFHDFILSHEFSHSLFRNWYKSEFEETKASLWYLLKIADFYDWKEIPYEESKYIIVSIFIEIIRQMERDWLKAYKKYILFAKTILLSFKNIWIIKIENKKIFLDYDSEKCDFLLNNSKNMLNLIKTIYEDNDKDDESTHIIWVNHLVKELYNKILWIIKEAS